eukprot:TRINITY_DN22672_c0_g1_i2.p1 TRINITY_DN22672_c0_g1~~TRINITY_DN22672_c0_g1_i2.p1  ORF type:complete len:223 (+),score=32.47 TRINITY_DN22672_c0_g1_i2:33-701(+)
MEKMAKIELVYFDINARGEALRLCFEVSGKTQELTDYRIPLFMESEQNAENWKTNEKPLAPFGGLPYLKVVPCTRADREDQRCIADEALAVGNPAITRATLQQDYETVLAEIGPDGVTGSMLAKMEQYVYEIKRGQQAGEAMASSEYLFGSRISFADIALFNAMDELGHGPRGITEMEAVVSKLRRLYPTIMQTHDVVRRDCAGYLEARNAAYRAKSVPESG